MKWKTIEGSMPKNNRWIFIKDPDAEDCVSIAHVLDDFVYIQSVLHEPEVLEDPESCLWTYMPKELVKELMFCVL